ncbi:metal-dependent hydrolase [Oxalobacteraceae bacterium R-40]|uniref:Metal-dependent hydrolase n=1 Tax=Keguizhuia sedimenti TaxID=3064264 RepID=A0ABU1BN66_9BURK|nr:metal-dependent hydrolase [Oxalobacteraceae bacterium R-40]
MDNLSHSLVGLAGGEFIHRCLPKEKDAEASRLRRRLLLFSCWFASNFPDLDLVLTPLLPEPLGYLLHHRGHTHTFLYALPQAVLAFITIWLLAPAMRLLLRESKAARLGIALSIALGLVLHIAMDYLNSYGIHPFHPFDSRWFYGDMVFIVEPMFWVTFGVPLVMMIPKPWLRLFLLVAIPGVLLYFTFKGFLLWASFAVLMLVGMLFVPLQQRAQKEGISALLAAFGFGAVFITAQALASWHARESIAHIRESRYPGAAMLDVALTPFPSNPFCWTFVSIESDEPAGVYRLRSGVLSLAPGTLPVAVCPAALLGASIDRNGSRDAIFLEHHEGNLRVLRELKDRNCHLQAWLRFARAPEISDGIASDMRFSFRSDDNFTTMKFADFSEKACPSHVPQWDFPRRDLLSERGK